MDVLDKLKLDRSNFEADLSTPKAPLCLEWASWSSLNSAAPAVAAAATAEGQPLPDPFVYDLVNTAREVLAQLSTPILLNFSAALDTNKSTAELINSTGALFVELLGDMDQLLATNTAFMLGPWLQSARTLGGNAVDCTHTQVEGDIGNCADFMEWNAKAQLTTWYPTIGSAVAPRFQQGGRDHDYARKQWSGILSDVYIPRAELYREQALRDVAAGLQFNVTAVSESYARLSFGWQTDYGNKYPTLPSGDPIAVSASLWAKWSSHFEMCAKY